MTDTIKSLPEVLDPVLIDKATRIIEAQAPADVVKWWPQLLQAVLPDQLLSITKRKACRDEHLCKAFALIQRASIRGFQARILRFATDTWPQVENYRQPPKSLTPIESELFCAFAYREVVPTSISQIHEILFGKSVK